LNKKILIIGYVWPEPKSSAAGRRMMQLIQFFKAEKYQVHFATPCAKSEHSFPLHTIDVETSSIALNNTSFDDFIKEFDPSVVLFDRFMMEEQFGWRAQEGCPNAVTILDTEDLHSLRKKRKRVLTGKKNNSKDDELELRELASIYRCDLSLIISQVEMAYLADKGIPDLQLLYLPFMETIPNETEFKSFDSRSNFVTIGTFLHEPNVDGIRYLKSEVWPLVRRKLPKVEMHIYGSYPNSKVEQLTNAKEGFFIKGWADSSTEVMSNSRLCLSPLRFGAGLKGKFVDAMRNGTPSITTFIGSEGMELNVDWPGFVSDSPVELADMAVELYLNSSLWEQKQKLCKPALELLFSKEVYFSILQERLNAVEKNLPTLRISNTIGAILKLNTLRSTKYMSKWIEEKNKNQE
tara:strand:- start:6171 stop:7391 length:1221 start_codon:yes stop_codon:yes gene_type:complete